MPNICNAGVLSAIASLGCNDRGGILRAAWTDADNITAITFDADNQITAITMEATTVFYELRIDPENSVWQEEQTDDSAGFEQLCTLYFKSLACDTRKALENAIRVCPIVLAVETMECQTYIMGVNKFGTSFKVQLPMPLKIGRVLSNAGQAGGDRARREVDLIGKSLTMAYCWDDDFDDLPGITPP
jgi:hypothetical protein